MLPVTLPVSPPKANPSVWVPAPESLSLAEFKLPPLAQAPAVIVAAVTLNSSVAAELGLFPATQAPVLFPAPPA